jgi:uncharacterized RDD family membrane protein YckC
MKSRFEPENQSDIDALSPALIDPEAYDASEQAFAASLEETASRKPRFVVEESASDASVKIGSDRFDKRQERDQQGRIEAQNVERDEGREKDRAEKEVANDEKTPAAESRTDANPASDPESWRREVAARLSHYRARRRPREPRYPSLQLRFETEPVWNEPAAADQFAGETATTSSGVDRPPAPTQSSQQYVARSEPPSFPRIRLAEPADYPRASFPASNEATAKVIEFASYSAPVRPFDELAEPVLERPRIIEAPALVPPLPALGGISIEPVEVPPNERRPGFEIPLRTAPMRRRMAAAGIDALLVAGAIGAFAYIFFRITNSVPSTARVAGTVLVLAGAFWCAYQYLLLVYSTTTPGLKLAKLELQMFDGEPVPRRTRRWRVLASVLSGVSLGLGYAWCLLDEDQLCWHDRITRTYMAPRK